MVPSCPEHNQAKAADDEYSQSVLAMLAAINTNTMDPEKRHPWLTRLIRRMRRGARYRAILESAREVETPFGTQVALTVDREALDHVMQATARALYFHAHECRRRWPGDCHVRTPELRGDDGSLPGSIDLLTIETALRRQPVRGVHHDVFYYQLFDRPERNVAAILMVLYRSVRFMAFTPPSFWVGPRDAGEDPTTETPASGVRSVP